MSLNVRKYCTWFSTGPPETMREHIVAAANAMKIGDWKKCRDYILDIKVHFVTGYELQV